MPFGFLILLTPFSLFFDLLTPHFYKTLDSIGSIFHNRLDYHYQKYGEVPHPPFPGGYFEDRSWTTHYSDASPREIYVQLKYEIHFIEPPFHSLSPHVHVSSRISLIVE